MSWGKLLGKVLRDGVLEQGLIETVKPKLEPAIDELKTAGSQLLQDNGWQSGPDPSADPKAALQHQLGEIVAAILQTPRSQAYYLLTEIVGVIPNLLAMHPQLGGLLGLARAVGFQFGSDRQPQGHAATGIASLLGGGRMAQVVARSSQAMLNGQHSYEAYAAQSREWDSLTPLQQQVVEQCGVLAALLIEGSNKPAITEAITQLQAVLNEQDQALYVGLELSHQQHLSHWSQTPLPKLAESTS